MASHNFPPGIKPAGRRASACLPGGQALLKRRATHKTSG